jgi:hypothetical protein
MAWKKILGFALMILMLLLVILYWYFPTSPSEFNFQTNPSTNFSINQSETMQFYPNMRFPTKDISYSISSECNIQKESEMVWAFEILEEETILNFYEVQKNAEINIFCEDTIRIENGMFIAGEGGPANVSLGNSFNVIMNGQILLLKRSDCERPNIAIHELLHVLGFEHSANINNIMYPVSKCKQVISKDMTSEIDRIYSIESNPDLLIESVSAEMHSRFLDTNLIIKNEGLENSEDFLLGIYANDKQIDKMNLKGIKIGEGRIINITNILIPQIRIDTLKFVLETEAIELDKQNNQVILDITKN